MANGIQSPEYLQFQGQFESIFQGQDFNRFLQDTTYRNQLIEQYFKFDPDRVNKFVGELAPVHGTLLAQIQEGGARDPIDVRSIFEPLKAEIDALTQGQIQAGRAEISAGAERARNVAGESLAGTGLGRSGVGAATFGGIERAAAERSEAFGQEARLRGEQAKFGIESKISEFEFKEQLRLKGEAEEDIDTATAYYRQMAALQYQSMLEQAANDPTWWETYGPLFEIVGGIVTAKVGGKS